MGILKKLAGSVGHVSKDVMENGLLGRGQITAVKQTGMTMGGGEHSAPNAVVCKFTVQVVLDNVAPYEATCKQRVSPYSIPPPGMVVAVRVNPDDHSEIAIDWEAAPSGAPQVIDLSGAPGAAAEKIAMAEQATGMDLNADGRIGAAPTGAAATTPPGEATDRVEGLERLAKLHESGALSEAEFAAEKAKLLGT